MFNKKQSTAKVSNITCWASDEVRLFSAKVVESLFLRRRDFWAELSFIEGPNCSITRPTKFIKQL